jgi:phage gpG-like protein
MSLVWNDKAMLRRVHAATEIALDQTAAVVQREVVNTLSQTKGAVIGKTPSGRNVYRSSPPGTAPGWRTGRLAGSISTRKRGKLTRQVGTNLKYARIHEFGGTINHPGGTAYMSVGNSVIGAYVFVSDKAAFKMQLSTGIALRRTRPHTITMPKRPFLFPTFERMVKSGQVSRTFGSAFRRALGATP